MAFRLSGNHGGEELLWLRCHTGDTSYLSCHCNMCSLWFCRPVLGVRQLLQVYASRENDLCTVALPEGSSPGNFFSLYWSRIWGETNIASTRLLKVFLYCFLKIFINISNTLAWIVSITEETVLPSKLKITRTTYTSVRKEKEEVTCCWGSGWMDGATKMPHLNMRQLFVCHFLPTVNPIKPDPSKHCQKIQIFWNWDVYKTF